MSHSLRKEASLDSGGTAADTSVSLARLLLGWLLSVSILLSQALHRADMTDAW